MTLKLKEQSAMKKETNITCRMLLQQFACHLEVFLSAASRPLCASVNIDIAPSTKAPNAAATCNSGTYHFDLSTAPPYRPAGA